DAKAGKREYRTDRGANVHVAIGKKSFDARQLVENYAALVDEIIRAKPAAAKGRYIRQITLATTMGPGIRVDTQKTRGIVEELEEGREAVPADSGSPWRGTDVAPEEGNQVERDRGGGFGVVSVRVP